MKAAFANKNCYSNSVLVRQLLTLGILSLVVMSMSTYAHEAESVSEDHDSVISHDADDEDTAYPLDGSNIEAQENAISRKMKKSFLEVGSLTPEEPHISLHGQAEESFEEVENQSNNDYDGEGNDEGPVYSSPQESNEDESGEYDEGGQSAIELGLHEENDDEDESGENDFSAEEGEQTDEEKDEENSAM